MHSSLSTLMLLSLLLAACDPSDETTTDTDSVTDSPDAGTDAGSGVVIPDAGSNPMPECTLADAQETLAGTWARNDAMDVWTEEEVALCKAKCENAERQSQCVQDNCPFGWEYAACVTGWHYYCASQPESGCSEDYRRFGCCVRANCAAADDEACTSTTCYAYVYRMKECADRQCATAGTDMCVR